MICKVIQPLIVEKSVRIFDFKFLKMKRTKGKESCVSFKIDSGSKIDEMLIFEKDTLELTIITKAGVDEFSDSFIRKY